MPVTSSSETSGQVAEHHERLVERRVDVVGPVPVLVHGRISAEHVVVGQQVGEAKLLDPLLRRRGRRRDRRRSRSAETRRRYSRVLVYHGSARRPLKPVPRNVARMFAMGRKAQEPEKDR